RPDGIAEVEKLFTSCRQTDDLEIWVSNDRMPSLCALLNVRCGWLMFLRFEGDTGFSSRNPSGEQSERGEEVFVLANGQVDAYPRSWTFDRAGIFDALLEFAKSGDRPSNVEWHDDSLN
ncbi:MAG: Imm1 family immunity protein, partial [Maritimibacter sp.]